MLAVNLMIGWQYDLFVVVPCILAGLAVWLTVRARTLHSTAPNLDGPYDWARQGI